MHEYTNFRIFWNYIFESFNVVSEKKITPETVYWPWQKTAKNALDQGKSYGALLTELSKAFNGLPHELIVAKLHACGFSLESLKLLNSYLTDQRVTIND